MSCSHNLSSRIIFKQLLDSIIDGSRECHIVSVEASMYLAAKAKDIGYFFKVQILNPVGMLADPLNEITMVFNEGEYPR